MNSSVIPNRALLKDSNLYVGIDAHKRSWSVSVFLESVFQKTFRQPADPKVLIKSVQEHYPEVRVHCAYECGRFGYSTQRSLEAAGFQCIVVNPSDIPRSVKQKLEKTDQVDSRMIAECLQAGMLRGIHVPSRQQEDDRLLVRARKLVHRDLVRHKNRIKGLLDYAGIQVPEEYDNANWSQGFLRWLFNLKLPAGLKATLDLHLEQLDFCHSLETGYRSKARALTKEDRYREDARLLCSIPGIGKLSAVTLITEIGDINRFSGFPYFCSWLGLKPMTHSSGEKDHRGRLTIRANHHLRSLLVESSWVLVRRDPAMALYYHQKKIKIGSKRAIVAVARKLASRLYRVLKNKEEYRIGIN
jgi:transposase